MHTHDSETTSSEQQRDHLWSLIKDIRFGMFTSSHPNGHLHSRPMTVQNDALDAADTLWFFMSRHNEAVADLSNAPAVNVSFADPDEDCYVSVAGNASVVEDQARKQQLWSPMAEAWFPGGPEDPDLALVGVRIIHADYWDVKSNKLVQLYKMAKAAMTGEPPTDMGEHGRVTMR